MKTVLFINSSGSRCFRRDNGLWRQIERPGQGDKVWVIANLPEEALEAFTLPFLFGSDRRNFLERKLAAAYPKSEFRAAVTFFGGMLNPQSGIITGLSSDEAIGRELAKLNVTVAGVWGMAMLMALIARRLSIADSIMVMPSVHFLRILVIKNGVPVLTRCIHRYGEENKLESDANEILRTRQHLENRHIFERAELPPVLYLADGASLPHADFTLLPLPAALLPAGDAGYLHPLFEQVISASRGQLAPLTLRAHHLAENIRNLAYAGIAASLLALVLFGQQDFFALFELHRREATLNAQLRRENAESDKLAGRIAASGIDPALLRQATEFAALEIDSAATPDAMLRFAAAAIANLPQARIRQLAFRFPKPAERYCQGPGLLSGILADKAADAARITELQFTLLQQDNLAPAAQIELNRHVSAAIKAYPGVRLLQDPAAFSLIDTLKGGFGIATGVTQNQWCIGIPWLTAPTEEPR